MCTENKLNCRNIKYKEQINQIITIQNKKYQYIIGNKLNNKNLKIN